MRWVDRINERASLMGRMLETIGAMDRIPDGHCVGQQLRIASSNCQSCDQTDTCRQWLDSNQTGAAEPLGSCPNADLFKSWLSAAAKPAQ